jgi:hypothetical protein
VTHLVKFGAVDALYQLLERGTDFKREALLCLCNIINDENPDLKDYVVYHAMLPKAIACLADPDANVRGEAVYLLVDILNK